ncbi:MAG TPA: hypothetical protein DCS07_01660 [Bdellovibrionales bacterium]|nr:MAG: hypothetical protein A2X97_06725 [Bdellovibrionales bacterium GWA1_52_35]OFZ40370.1 MAG: hypothetical protein A2070_15245 [Bdellovibrionales bacterium GWC1_52_8]HAR41331.1 hypothetical protein [Bdellovibrionales bacterium]HCM40814.1 hypothetical protein [Bdellovibrionales bacterium]
MSQILRRLSREQNGQAVVEYVLMISFALMVVTALGIGFRKILFRVWEDITQKTVGGSPLQPSQPKYNIR